jgi:preprotein translocase subunit SecA
VLQGRDTEQLVRDWIDEVIEGTVASTINDEVAPSEWDREDLHQRLSVVYPTRLTPAELVSGAHTLDDVVEKALEDAQVVYSVRAEELGEKLLRSLERTVVLSIVDNKWREHLAEMDYLRSGVGLRAMGQRDPLTEYQREAYDMFSEMVDSIKDDAVKYLYHAQIVQQTARPDPVVQLGGTGGAALKRQATANGKVGRNEPCPCGSGKKYKKCHGAAA